MAGVPKRMAALKSLGVSSLVLPGRRVLYPLRYAPHLRGKIETICNVLVLNPTRRFESKLSVHDAIASRTDFAAPSHLAVENVASSNPGLSKRFSLIKD